MNPLRLRSAGLLLALLCLCRAGLLHADESTKQVEQAQAKPDQAEPGNHNVHLRFVLMPVGACNATLELQQGEGRALEVEAPSNELSQVYHVARQEVWAVGGSAMGEGKKPVFTPYGQVQALQASEQIVVLLRKGPADADGFEVTALDSDIGHFAGGSMFLINQCPQDIACEIAVEKFVLKCGEFRLVRPIADDERQMVSVMLSHPGADGAMVPFMKTMWPVMERSRSLVGIQQDAMTGRLRLQVIRDEVPSP